MPHMAPIMWALIMFMTFSMILIMLTMIYFGSSPVTPEWKKIAKQSYSSSWPW
uniref:ATP synthase F0 subunit 8 n=1 Tax=Megabalanus coccopoma TaxID=864464 RepID=UPI00226C850E|nr:ATP synthase F0 subunit 8 [Megabalanus coccopoma]UZN92553.1 ATP synthase F0 subunit 8 [Megabalanus coccopoma]